MMKIKCIDNKGNEWFKAGMEYKAWRDGDGVLYSECELDSAYHGRDLNNEHGVFELVKEEKSHPHADLMMKYAMIAQHDDKPWESFEVLLDGEWVDCEHEGLYAGIEYRLKPQEPKIKVGQVWADCNGVDVEVINSVNGMVAVEAVIGGLSMPLVFGINYFLQNFKLKDSK